MSMLMAAQLSTHTGSRRLQEQECGSKLRAEYAGVPTSNAAGTARDRTHFARLRFGMQGGYTGSLGVCSVHSRGAHSSPPALNLGARACPHASECVL